LIKCKVGLPHAYVALTDFGYSVQTIWLTCSQRHLHYLAFQSMRASDEVFSKNVLCEPTFYYWTRTQLLYIQTICRNFRTD